MRMLLKNRTLRLILFAAPALALAAAALFLALGPGSGDPASADAPHAGLNFAIGIDFNGDQTNDCGTGVPSAVGDGAPDPATADVSNATCNAAAGAALKVNVYLMNAGGIAYAGVASQITFTGVTSKGRGTSVWAGHVFDASAFDPTYENAASAIGLPPAAAPQTNLGLVNQYMFTCTASGEMHLGHASGETGLTDDALVEHREAGPDSLTVNCGPVSGPTNTPVAPTNTPVPPTTGPTAVPTTPGPTATTGPTNTPTNTVPPTATRTPMPTVAVSKCDVNGDGHITSEDGLWILWKEAGIVDHVPLPENADCNHDGHVNSIDALFVLWHEGGRI